MTKIPTHLNEPEITMSEHDINTLIRLWNNRVPIAKITQLLPYKPYHITYMLKTLKKNGTLREENRIVSKKDRVVSMYMSGEKDIAKLAEMFELTPQRVRDYLRASGISLERPKKYKPQKMKDKKQAIISDLKSGKKQSQIARDYSVSRQYINQIYKRYIEKGE